MKNLVRALPFLLVGFQADGATVMPRERADPRMAALYGEELWVDGFLHSDALRRDGVFVRWTLGSVEAELVREAPRCLIPGTLKSSLDPRSDCESLRWEELSEKLGCRACEARYVFETTEGRIVARLSDARTGRERLLTLGKGGWSAAPVDPARPDHLRLPRGGEPSSLRSDSTGSAFVADHEGQLLFRAGADAAWRAVDEPTTDDDVRARWAPIGLDAHGGTSVVYVKRSRTMLRVLVVSFETGAALRRLAIPRGAEGSLTWAFVLRGARGELFALSNGWELLPDGKSPARFWSLNLDHEKDMPTEVTIRRR